MSIEELQQEYNKAREKYENSVFLLSMVRNSYREEDDYRVVLAKLKDFIKQVNKEDIYKSVMKLDENNEELTREEVRHAFEAVSALEDVSQTDLLRKLYGLEHEINDLKRKG